MATIFLKPARKKRPHRRAKPIDFSAMLAEQLADVLPFTLEHPVREFEFHPIRKWKADLAWPRLSVLVECEGGIFQKGRHTRGLGYREDCHKYNEAARLGFSVFRFDSDLIKNGSAAKYLFDVLTERAAKRE